MTEKFREFLSWKIYQIYPRSFLDTNGDGIGDLQGVICKLDYLKELGINAIWLCPCYKSPNEDHGYDVADYRDIMDEFGTMDDIRQLIDQLHKRGMKLIMDLVPNHTSSQHKWFQESRKSKDNPYSDYYYWFDSPPNDWQSCFGGSAWQYDEGRNQYYLHSYAVGQPDLNWENPAVVKEMQDVVDFWVDMGVDGFSIDVIDQISKDFKKGQNMFGPRLHEYIHALFGREKTKRIFTVGECWTEDIEEMRRHIAPDRDELSTLFQFDHLNCGRRPEDKFIPGKKGLQYLWDTLSYWQELTQEYGLLHSLFTDNHDNGWFLDRAGNRDSLRYEAATCIATLVYLLRGVPFIYQGQEIGMVDPSYDAIDSFDDVESVNRYNDLLKSVPAELAMEQINFGSRDNARRPMCWDGSDHAGFSDHTPWLPTHSEYRRINLQKDLQSQRSVWRYYQKLLQLRDDHDALTFGSFQKLSSSKGCGMYIRRTSDGEILVVCNFEKAQTIALPECIDQLLLSNYGYLQKSDAVFEPYEAAVFQLK